MRDSNSAFPAWLAALVALAVGFGLGIGGAMILDPATARVRTLEKEKKTLLFDQANLALELQTTKQSHAALQQFIADKNVELEEIRDNLAARKKADQASYNQLVAERDALALQVKTLLDDQPAESPTRVHDEVNIASSYDSALPWLTPEWRVRMTESDADYQNHSWQVSVKNSGRETVTPAIYLQWIDKDGFVIKEEFVDNSREIYPGETETFRGTSLIDNQEVDQFYEVTCKITE